MTTLDYLGSPLSKAGTDLGEGVRGVHLPPSLRWSLLLHFAFKICLPYQSVTPFLRGTPLLRKILASTPAKEWGICILISYEYSALLHCEISSLLLIVQRAFILYRAVIEGSNPQHLLQPRMADFPLTLWVTLPVVERIHPKRNKFAMGVQGFHSGPGAGQIEHLWGQVCPAVLTI